MDATERVPPAYDISKTVLPPLQANVGRARLLPAKGNSEYPTRNTQHSTPPSEQHSCCGRSLQPWVLSVPCWILSSSFPHLPSPTGGEGEGSGRDGARPSKPRCQQRPEGAVVVGAGEDEVGPRKAPRPVGRKEPPDHRAVLGVLDGTRGVDHPAAGADQGGGATRRPAWTSGSSARSSGRRRQRASGRRARTPVFEHGASTSAASKPPSGTAERRPSEHAHGHVRQAARSNRLADRLQLFLGPVAGDHPAPAAHRLDDLRGLGAGRGAEVQDRLAGDRRERLDRRHGRRVLDRQEARGQERVQAHRGQVRDIDRARPRPRRDRFAGHRLGAAGRVQPRVDRAAAGCSSGRSPRCAARAPTARRRRASRGRSRRRPGTRRGWPRGRAGWVP